MTYRSYRQDDRPDFGRSRLVEGFAELQGDVVSSRAIAVLRLLRPELEKDGGPTADELMGWDAKMEASSTAATRFSNFMLALERAIGDDEARRDGLDWNPIDAEHVLRLLAGGLDEHWWHYVGSSVGPSKSEIVQRVLADMDRQGPPSSWGDVHRLRYDHPLSRVPFIGKLAADSWSRGPFPVPGDNVTINAQYWSVRRPYRVTSIPALRFVTEVGNWDNTVLVLPVGQSGRPWSPHYSDQISEWLDLEPVRMPFSPEAVAAAAKAKLEILPTRESGRDERLAP